MKVSLNSFAFGPVGGWVPSYLIEEAIQRTAKIGYSGIELAAIRPHLWPYDVDKEQRKPIKKLLKDSHLEVPAVSAFQFGLNLTSPLEQERKDGLDYLIECIELCADLEAKVLVVVPGIVVYGTPWEEAWKMAISSMSKVARRAEELGVIIGIEFENIVWSNLVITSHQACKMMEELNSPSVKLMLDSAHAFYGGENLVDVVKLFGENLVHVHFVDCAKGVPETRVVPGRGDVDLVSFVETLREIEYEGYLTVEMWGPQPEKYAREALEHVNNLLGC